MEEFEGGVEFLGTILLAGGGELLGAGRLVEVAGLGIGQALKIPLLDGHGEGRARAAGLGTGPVGDDLPVAALRFQILGGAGDDRGVAIGGQVELGGKGDRLRLLALGGGDGIERASITGREPRPFSTCQSM